MVKVGKSPTPKWLVFLASSDKKGVGTCVNCLIFGNSGKKGPNWPNLTGLAKIQLNRGGWSDASFMTLVGCSQQPQGHEPSSYSELSLN